MPVNLARDSEGTGRGGGTGTCKNIFAFAHQPPSRTRSFVQNWWVFFTETVESHVDFGRTDIVLPEIFGSHASFRR